MLLFLFGVLAVLFVLECVRLNYVARRVRGPWRWPLLYNQPRMYWGMLMGTSHIDRIREMHEHFRGLTYQVRMTSTVTVNSITWRTDNIEYVLQTNFKNYNRSRVLGENFRELLGHGIFTSSGEQWKRQRRWAVPIFATSYLEQRMIPTFNVHLDDIITSLLRDGVAHARLVDSYQMFMTYTFSTFVQLGLGCTDLLTLDEKHLFARSFDYMSEACFARIRMPKMVWNYVYGKRFAESEAALDAIISKCIAHRRQEPEEKLRAATDIFSTCLLYRDDDGNGLSDRELRDMFLNFVIAGRDTTAVTLTWTFYELGLDENAAVLERLEREIDAEVPRTGAITPEHLARLTYTRQVMMETLRMHPPVPGDSRTAVADDTLPDGTPIRAGESCSISLYSAGRLLYERGDTYDPDRWSSADSRSAFDKGFKSPFFWHGPQRCLGERMAYAEAMLVIAHVLRNGYRLSRSKDAGPLRIVPTLILQPRGGMPCVVTKRTLPAAATTSTATATTTTTTTAAADRS